MQCGIQLRYESNSHLNMDLNIPSEISITHHPGFHQGLLNGDLNLIKQYNVYGIIMVNVDPCIHGEYKVSRLCLRKMRAPEHYVKHKALFETCKKVNGNKVLSYCEALRYM